MQMMGGGVDGEQQYDNVVLTATNTGAILDSLQHNREWNTAPLYRRAGICTSVAFGGKSRYLCLGDTSGAVCLWDLKKRTRARQFFHDRYPSNQVMLDPTDRYVLSLSDEIFNVYNLREGTLAASIMSPPNSNFGSYSKFCMSQIEPHVAAIGTRGGSLLLFDIVTAAAMSNGNNIKASTQPSTNNTTATPFATMNHCHSNAITGIAISKTNPQLIASSSLDGTLNFIDIKSNELIHEEIVTTTAATGGGGHNKRCSITCLSLHSDGISCAVGTNTGNVVVYDIRKVNCIVAQLQVQNAVTNIQYALPPKNSKSGGGGGGIASSSTPVRPTTTPTPRSQQQQYPQQQYQQQQPQEQYRHQHQPHDQQYDSSVDTNNRAQGGQQHPISASPAGTNVVASGIGRGVTTATGARATTTAATVHSEYQSTANISYQGPDDEMQPPSLQQERQQPIQSQQQQQQGNINQSTMPEPPQPTIDMVRKLGRNYQKRTKKMKFDHFSNCSFC